MLKKYQRRNCFAILCVIFFVLSMLVVSAQAVFSDIDRSFARQDILDLANKGILNGYGDGTFRPLNNITRAEFLGLSMKALRFPVDYRLPVSTTYTDIPVRWMVPYVEKARELGIEGQTVNGNNVFRPNDPVTRAEAISILLNVSGLNIIPGNPNDFYDLNEEWQMRYISTAKSVGIIDGQDFNGKKIFRPNDPMTREEAARVIEKTLAIPSVYGWMNQTQSPTASPATVYVNIINQNFAPSSITIHAGDTVKWRNADPLQHTISFTFKGQQVISPILKQVEIFSYTFDSPAEVDYICSIHPYMTGHISVR